MDTWLHWLNSNSAAIQAVSTVVLVAVTSWYAIRTHQLTTITNEQLKLVRRSQQPDLAVSFNSVFVTMSDGQLIPAFTMTAANRGLLPLTVDTPFIQLPDNRTLVFPKGFEHSEVRFPHRLDPGDACKVIIDIGDLVEGLASANYPGTVQLRGAFRDKIDTVYVSETFEFEADVWMRRLRKA